MTFALHLNKTTYHASRLPSWKQTDVGMVVNLQILRRQIRQRVRLLMDKFLRRHERATHQSAAANSVFPETPVVKRHFVPPQPPDLGPLGNSQSLHPMQQHIQCEIKQFVADNDVRIPFLKFG